ncbi:hypothetical protein L1887_11057 [Cichorium endivia]|nr:hypothetical protein L1887_11057 [Cichorium endivia]
MLPDFFFFCFCYFFCGFSQSGFKAVLLFSSDTCYSSTLSSSPFRFPFSSSHSFRFFSGEFPSRVGSRFIWIHFRSGFPPTLLYPLDDHRFVLLLPVPLW